MSLDRLRVLLTNDDGPPSAFSPYIYGFSQYLINELNWDVKVVIPSTQKSWIGKAFHITEIIEGTYYYPQAPEGQGETCAVARPLKDNEVAEWILLDGTPATCANVGIHNLFPGEIDLVISGPNFGRNTSAAFALSSGTLGAALSSSLCSIRSIAVSYGTVARPIPTAYFEPAHALAGRIIHSLHTSWGSDPDHDPSNISHSDFSTNGPQRGSEIDLYSINIPMVEELVSDGGMRVMWTKLWRNSYGRLFKVHTNQKQEEGVVNPGGPDADAKAIAANPINSQTTSRPPLSFKFSPDMKDLINPTSVPVGTDAWAIANNWASVTPLRATFAEPTLDESREDVEVGEHAESDEAARKVYRFKL